jgi:alkaline phosphatase D
MCSSRFRILHLLCFCFLSVFSLHAQEPLTTIAFGSCDHQDNPVKLWDKILEQRPQLWIWGGDNIYGDSYVMDTLRAKFARQKSNLGYAKLRASAMITGTWDDHDYGLNDGGKEYIKRSESRELLFDFLDIPADDPARKHEGAYHSRVYGPPGRQVKVINLDTRYFRDSLRQELFRDPASGRMEKKNLPAPGLDILGAEQWNWLEQELRQSTAAVNIINSSIQVIAAGHRFEKWANFPDAQERLYRLIASSGAQRVFIISGDRHIAECSRIQKPYMKMPLFDVTSSGLTHTWPVVRTEENADRVGDLVVKRNYGLIRIDWQRNSPKISVEIRGHDEVPYAVYRLFE